MGWVTRTTRPTQTTLGERGRNYNYYYNNNNNNNKEKRTNLVPIGLLVRGLLCLCVKCISMLFRSYELPSSATTGLDMISSVMGHRNSCGVVAWRKEKEVIGRR